MKGLCSNTDCYHPNEEQTLYDVILRNEFNNDLCRWCESCLYRDEDMIERVLRW